MKFEYGGKDFRQIKLIENKELFDNERMKKIGGYYTEKLNDTVKKERKFAVMQCFLWR